MRRFAFVAAALALVPAFVPAKADASLRQRVNRLEAKMSCLVRFAASEYPGYAFYDDNGDVVTHVNDILDSAPALNLQTLLDDRAAPDVWLVAVKNTRACKLRFALGANPYARVARERAASFRLMRLRRLQ